MLFIRKLLPKYTHYRHCTRSWRTTFLGRQCVTMSLLYFFPVPLDRGSSRSKRKGKKSEPFLWKWVSSVFEYYIMIWEILILPQFHSCIRTVIVYVGRSNQGISYICNKKILTFAYCGRFAVPRRSKHINFVILRHVYVPSSQSRLQIQ